MIHQTTVDYLCNLINIDTTINSNNEIEGILYIKEVFDKIGIENKVYEPVSGKGNIIATIKGKSDDAIILHSHIDTANYNAENWLFPPQKATLVNNCIVGRGTLDCIRAAAMLSCSDCSLCSCILIGRAVEVCFRLLPSWLPPSAAQRNPS